MTTSSSVNETIRHLLRAALLPGFALSLLAALWTTTHYQVKTERESARNEAVAHSQSLAHTLAEHVGHILRQTDHATQLFKLKFEETDGRLRLPEFTKHNGLMDSVLPAKLDLPIALINKDGKVVDSAHAFMPDNVSGEAWFRTLASATADTPLFTTPIADARSKKWHIQVSRPLTNRQGEFAGVIVIMIDPAYFVDDYDRLNVDDQGTLVLMSRDAGLSIGRVGERIFISDQVDFVPPREPGHPADELVATRAFDQVTRIYSYRDMPRYSLVAVVGISEDTAMAHFERRRVAYLWSTIAATLMILGVSSALMLQSARLRASIVAAREAQATLRAAADGSLDAVVIFQAWPGRGRKTTDFVITDINERAAAMMKYERSQLIGQKAFSMLPRLQQTGFFDTYLKVHESGQPLEEEVELRTGDDPPFWLHHQIVPIGGGVAVTSRNITERKRTEIEMRNNRNFLHSLIDHLPLLIYVKCVQCSSLGTMIVWNKAAESVTGYRAGDVVGRLDTDAFPPDFALRNADEDRAMVANPVVNDNPDKPLPLADGSLRYLHTISVPLFDESGKVEYILCIAEDITRRREQEQALRSNEAAMAAVTNASPLGLVRADINGACTYANRMFETITGLRHEQALGMGWLDAVHPEDRGFLAAAFEHQQVNKEPFKVTLRSLHPAGHVVIITVKISAVRIGDAIEGYVGTLDDVTSLHEAELALQESESRLRTIADTLPAMVAYIDANQVYRFHNIAYDREFGQGRRQVEGRTIAQAVGAERYARLEPYINRVLKGETLVFEETDERNGVERTLEATYIPQLAQDGTTVVGFHVMRQDITSQKREKKRLIKLAQVDALTGLVNRAGFLHKLAEAMATAAESGQTMALMYMDIDRFKPVNDTYGHNVGDALLKTFSARLTHTMRATDTIARLGGDEFTIIMEKIARPDDASHIAEKIVAAMQAPFKLDDITVSVSASVGLAFYSGGAMTPEALLKEADMLLYQAKEGGRNTYRAAA